MVIKAAGCSAPATGLATRARQPTRIKGREIGLIAAFSNHCVSTAIIPLSILHLKLASNLPHLPQVGAFFRPSDEGRVSAVEKLHRHLLHANASQCPGALCPRRSAWLNPPGPQTRRAEWNRHDQVDLILGSVVTASAINRPPGPRPVPGTECRCRQTPAARAGAGRTFDRPMAG